MQNDDKRLALIRHGQTAANTRNLFTGAGIEVPLSAVGMQQAEITGRHLQESGEPFTAVYSSPLGRAYDTAKIIASHLGLAVHIDPDLREFDFGIFDGLSLQEVHETDPDIAQHWSPKSTQSLPQGESGFEVAQRVEAAMRRIIDNIPGGRQAVVVSHMGAIAMFLAEVLQDEKNVFHYAVSNCSISWLVVGEEPRLIALNTSEHLAPLDQDSEIWLPGDQG